MDTTVTRQRFLQDRVLTATPAQRVVMLYDRLSLDLTRARAGAGAGADRAMIDAHLDHAFQVVAELLCSLDQSAGGPADNLALIYGYLLRELVDAQLHGPDRIASICDIVEALRGAWTAVAAAEPATTAPVAAGAGWTA